MNIGELFSQKLLEFLYHVLEYNKTLLHNFISL